MELTLRLDDLKNIERDNPISVGNRRERTAEHAWHVAMATLLWAPESPLQLDVPRAVTLAVVHDFPELFVGDRPVFGPDTDTRFEDETAAMAEFVNVDDTKRASEVHAWWHEYEHMTSAEGRFVMAIDVLLPILHNFSQLDSSSWRRRSVRAVQVRTRIESVRPALPWLAARADDCVASAVDAGALTP